jgi:enoyl-[acyl-carrier protein] reductase II
MSFEKNRICELLNIQYPIIQAGMIWCSGWKLASAVSNFGALGVIGAGSMSPEVLEEHILKCKQATDKPFAVNIPLLYSQIDLHIDLIIKHKVPVVISSAGSPKKYTSLFKQQGIKVLHVVSSSAFALKSQEAGVDAVIAEGFEAGGHNGREETTTLCLIPAVAQKIDIPLVAAGGISSGKSMLAVMALGADAVQIGSRFVTSEESSAHINFKFKVIEAQEGATKLSLKKLTPVRLLENPFSLQVKNLEENGANDVDLQELLGKGRAKKGMFQGDMKEGELEIGQCASIISSVLPAKAILEEILSEFESVKTKINHF